MPDEPAARRPLKSRSSAWAGGLARALLKAGFTPNPVSVLSVAGAALAGSATVWAGHSGHPWVFWLLAALGIQFRLVCNLMDGMLAVEGGLKSATGDLFNEIPDRFADALILVPLGYAAGTPWTIALGWAPGSGPCSPPTCGRSAPRSPGSPSTAKFSESAAGANCWRLRRKENLGQPSSG